MLLTILALPVKVTTSVGCSKAIAVLQVPQSELSDVNNVSNKFNSTWRYTNRGWTDMTKLDRPEPIKFERRIELVHPLIFALCVILVAFGLLIWASEEWHWARVMGEDQKG